MPLCPYPSIFPALHKHFLEIYYALSTKNAKRNRRSQMAWCGWPLNLVLLVSDLSLSDVCVYTYIYIYIYTHTNSVYIYIYRHAYIYNWYISICINKYIYTYICDIYLYINTDTYVSDIYLLKYNSDIHI